MARTKIENMETAAIVDEYNELTGKSIKKFASRAKAEEALAAAREEARKPKPKRPSVRVKGVVYKSVPKAFEALRLSVGKVQKFRKELNLCDEGELDFKHDGKTYKFTTIPLDA